MKNVTFNLRCDVHIDGENRWQFRKGLILDKLNEEMPDTVGFQEVTPVMADFLKRYLSDRYTFVGCGRNADYQGENNMIAFRKDRYELMFFETFWLSDTPDVPGSRYENQSHCPRICTHIILRVLENSRLFHVYNTHLDHQSDEARVLGAKAVMRHMADDLERFDYPVILTGDMNAYPDSQPIASFLNDEEVALINQTPCFPSSYHAYGTKEAPQIDYIFTKGFRAVAEPVAWGQTEYGKFLSDHNALCAYLELIEK